MCGIFILIATSGLLISRDCLDLQKSSSDTGCRAVRISLLLEYSVHLVEYSNTPISPVLD